MKKRGAALLLSVLLLLQMAVPPARAENRCASWQPEKTS